MKKDIVIFYDMDEVLNYFSKSIIDRYNKDFDDNYDWTKNTCYWWEDAPKANKEYFVNLLNSEGIFLSLEPRKDGIYYMRKLIEEGYDVRILTYPVWNEHCAKEKILWLKKYIPAFDIEKLCMTKDKYLLSGPNRILLDDNVDNLILWQEYGGIAIRFKVPFPQEWNGLTVSSHKEFYDYIHSL